MDMSAIRLRAPQMGESMKRLTGGLVVLVLLAACELGGDVASRPQWPGRIHQHSEHAVPDGGEVCRCGVRRLRHAGSDRRRSDHRARLVRSFAGRNSAEHSDLWCLHRRGSNWLGLDGQHTSVPSGFDGRLDTTDPLTPLIQGRCHSKVDSTAPRCGSRNIREYWPGRLPCISNRAEVRTVGQGIRHHVLL